MDKYKILGFTTVPAALLFSAGVLLGLIVDSWNTLSLILTSITITLAIAIFAFQQHQNGKLEEVLEKVRETNVEMHEVLASKRRRIADLILSRIVEFEKGHQHVLSAYKTYNDETKYQEFRDDAVENIFEWNKRVEFLEVKGCDDPVMYDTFNEPIPSMYRELLESAYAVRLIDKEEGVEKAFQNIKIIKKQIEPLTRELLKYSTPEWYEEQLEYYSKESK